MSKLEVVYRRFFQFWLISQTKIISHAQKDIISTDADITHTLPLRKKRFSISGNLFRTSGRTTKVLSCWRYRWLACVLSRVVRTSSPGSRPRQFFPSLPNPGMVSWSSWRNSSTASAEKFSYNFYYNEGLENKLTRAPLLGLAKSLY